MKTENVEMMRKFECEHCQSRKQRWFLCSEREHVALMHGINQISQELIESLKIIYQNNFNKINLRE